MTLNNVTINEILVGLVFSIILRTFIDFIWSQYLIPFTLKKKIFFFVNIYEADISSRYIYVLVWDKDLTFNEYI